MLALLPLLGPVLERLAALIPDPQARARAVAEAQAQMVAALQASDAGQAATNTAEAASASLFVAGWRPAMGWLCVVLLAYALAGRALLSLALGVALPAVDTSDLWTLVTGMLGLGAMRSFDKARGVDTAAVRR